MKSKDQLVKKAEDIREREHRRHSRIESFQKDEDLPLRQALASTRLNSKASERARREGEDPLGSREETARNNRGRRTNPYRPVEKTAQTRSQGKQLQIPPLADKPRNPRSNSRR